MAKLLKKPAMAWGIRRDPERTDKKQIETIIGMLEESDRFVNDIRSEVKDCGRMTITLECKFTNILSELEAIRKTFESIEVDGDGGRE